MLTHTGICCVIKFPCEKDFGECLYNINIYKMVLMNPMPNWEIAFSWFLFEFHKTKPLYWLFSGIVDYKSPLKVAHYTLLLKSAENKLVMIESMMDRMYICQIGKINCNFWWKIWSFFKYLIVQSIRNKSPKQIWTHEVR